MLFPPAGSFSKSAAAIRKFSAAATLQLEIPPSQADRQASHSTCVLPKSHFHKRNREPLQHERASESEPVPSSIPSSHPTSLPGRRRISQRHRHDRATTPT